MSSRDTFFRHLLPRPLSGTHRGDWLQLLREPLRRHPPPSPAAGDHVPVPSEQRLRREEDLAFGPKVKDVAIPPPLFVLGHWRSGTTHLHNLLTVDERFAFPNNYQALFPHAFLSTEARSRRLIGRFLPPRRPMDNIEWDMRSPQEDEFALCITDAHVAVHGLGLPAAAGPLRPLPHVPRRPERTRSRGGRRRSCCSSSS